MASNPIRSVTLAGSSILGAAGNEFFRWLAAQLEVTSSAYAVQRERAAHLAILAALVCAGALVRFWGLDNVGLHGDEETMAMAVMHILKDGTPVLPSGMLYPRGLSQLYLMALSVQAFGESEWALRLPSALCGVLLIPLAYLAGRRFLRPHWNLAFAASVALLPDLIIYSQTARMYIFMLASIATAMICIFAWERSGRSMWLAGAMLALLLGIDFQALTVTSVLLLLMPGIVQHDRRKFTAGLAAIAVVMLFYVLFDAWVNAQYPVPPPEFAADLGPPHWLRTRQTQPFALSFQIALWTAGVAVAFFALRVAHSIPARSPSVGVALLLLAVVLCQLALMYHIAGLLFIGAFVIARRHASARTMPQFWIYTLGAAVIALVHGTVLAARPGSIIKIVGAMVGEPSVWPYVRIAQSAPAAGVLAGCALAWAIWQLSSRKPATDYSMLALLGVWIPMLAIGTFLWSMPSRYTAASLLPMLMCALAFAQHLVDWVRERWARPAGSVALQSLLAGLLAVLVIDPSRAAGVINRGYERHPDHKGAAEFMRSLQLTAEDVVIAEDVLQQTYYLGSVDYWLIGRKHARRYVERFDGRIVDFYTHTPVISTAATLEAVLQREQGKRIFIIGSGENQKDGRRDMRGDINDVLRSGRFTIIFTGRDELTHVWRVPSAAAADLAAAVQKSQPSTGAALAATPRT